MKKRCTARYLAAERREWVIIRKRGLVWLIAMLCLSVLTVSAMAAEAEGNEAAGWRKVNGVWTYQEASGVAAVGWRQLGGEWYFFDDGGAMLTGWQQIDGDWYYLDDSGAMHTGWIKPGYRWYFMSTSGAMRTGWLLDRGTWYYLEETGAMATGWQQIDGDWYYLDDSGAMLTGWIKPGYRWYFMEASGAMHTGWLHTEDGLYYLEEAGWMATGWQRIDDRWYFFGDSGRGYADAWLKSGVQWYYFGTDGAMLTDTTEDIGGQSYRFDPEGRWISPLQQAMEATAAAALTEQMVLVVDHDLTYWEKNDAGLWVKKMDTYCGYGKNGLMAAETRVAGNMTTPIGAFPLILAFGTGDNPGTAMTYQRITDDSYWSAENDDTYNTWVESDTDIVGEHLIDYYQYKYALAIGFNSDPAVYGRGSAIFLHCKSVDHWYTAGCVSLAEDDMLWLMQKVRDGAYIIIVPTAKDLSAY